MPRWRVVIPRMNTPSTTLPALEVVVEAELVAVGSGAALVFFNDGVMTRALAPGQWLHLTLLDSGVTAAKEDTDPYTLATQAASE